MFSKLPVCIFTQPEKFLMARSIICSILFYAMLATTLHAQGYTSYSLPNLPVEFDYPSDLVLEKTGKKSWVVYDKNVGTEFNINLYHVSPRFNADSLRYMMLKLYEDPEVKNLQVSEVGSGTMGPHRAEKLVLSFMGPRDKQYVSTIYLVYFHINQEYNSLIFYFEIGANNVISYAPLQEAMISSLRYKPFSYKKTSFEKEQLQIEYPDFWTETQVDTGVGYLHIHDGRLKFFAGAVTRTDSMTLKTFAENERDSWKKQSTIFPNIKIKSQSIKCKNGETQFINSGTFDQQLYSITRNITFKKYFIRRIVNGITKDFVIYWEYPTNAEKYYTPVHDIMMESLKLPGNPELPEKK
jgi:hypothetical protein